jgi:hypothetical protein
MNRSWGGVVASWLALSLLALSSGGCSLASWRDRAHDFAQIFDASVTVGPGMAADVRVTELAQVGVGDFDGDSVGLMDGRLALAREQRSELGVSLLHTYEYRRTSRQLLDVRDPHYADPGYDEHALSWQMQSDRRPADVGFGIHVAYVGVSCAVHLDQLWDFVAGCFGLDPLHDDAYGRSLDDLRRQACSLDADLRDRAFDALKRRGQNTHGYAIYTATDARPSFQRRAMEAVAQERVSEPAPSPTPATDRADGPGPRR